MPSNCPFSEISLPVLTPCPSLSHSVFKVSIYKQPGSGHWMSSDVNTMLLRKTQITGISNAIFSSKSQQEQIGMSVTIFMIKFTLAVITVLLHESKDYKQFSCHKFSTHLGIKYIFAL